MDRRGGLLIAHQRRERVTHWFDEVAQKTEWGKDYSADIAGGIKVEGGIPFFARLLLTPPIRLVYRPESEQIDTYFQCEVMNTVRLRRPKQPYDAFDGPGRDLLLAALGRRVELNVLLPNEAARNRLVTVSGGAIRASGY